MGHGITKTDTFGEVRSGGKRAWHRLGIEIEDGLTAQEAFPLIGLDWETELGDMTFKCGTGQFETVSNPDGSIGRREIMRDVPAKGIKMHYRKDTGEELGAVDKNYPIVQNVGGLAAFADALAGEDSAITVETAGSLMGGRRVFCLVKLPGIIRIADDDVMEKYINLSNGHGGFASFQVDPTSVRVCCKNTQSMVDNAASNGLRMVHKGDMEGKLALARKLIGIAEIETSRFETQAHAMVGLGLSVGMARAFIEDAWTAVFGEISDNLDESTRDRALAKRKADVDRMVEMFETKETCNLPGIEGTAWAAFNAVTEWHDHERGRFKPLTMSDSRVHPNLFGTVRAAKRKVLSRALALVK